MADEKKCSGWRLLVAKAIRATFIAYRYLNGDPPKKYSKTQREIFQSLSRMPPGHQLLMEGIINAMVAGEITGEQLDAAGSDGPSPEVITQRLGAMLAELDTKTALKVARD